VYVKERKRVREGRRQRKGETGRQGGRGQESKRERIFFYECLHFKTKYKLFKF
jgi:hypothetical protein